ncbi:peptidylprolyl isomerase [Flavitalea flava]
MRKRSLVQVWPLIFLLTATVCSTTVCSTASAQTLFTCAGKTVSKDDFLKAYNKNNNGAKASGKSYREYLELYIRYKLKVRAAYEAGLDTLQSQRSELQNFRSQIADNYLKDEASLDKLIHEAYARSQNDLHLAHIFIAIKANASPADTLAAFEKARVVYSALKKGKNFSETAIAYSDDPSVHNNGGDIGYITLFTLPYDLETLAYSTPQGQFSKPFHGRAGYHIFKNLGERKSLGRIKVAQIMISFPPGATTASRVAAHAKADSVYDKLLKGANFADLAKLYSGDNLSYQSGGEMPEFGVGKYDSAFEAAAFALDKDGAVSKPIATSYGYHIVKRLGRTPVSRQFDKETEDLLKQQTGSDPRIQISRKALLHKIHQEANFSLSSFSREDLFAFTDSVAVNKPLSSYRNIFYNTVLFSFTKQSYSAKDWLDFATAVKSRQTAGSRTPANKALFEEYTEKVSLDYYRSHLEEYNPDFAFQLMEFKEGNLLFEIMQKRIWDKASTDSSGLRNYYDGHKDKYWWDASADALLFTCNNEKTASDLKKELEMNPYDWKNAADSAGAAAQADSGRYELTQISAGPQPVFNPRTFTSFVTNPADNTVSFSYILNVYKDRSPRNYRDARGFVINDYQAFLEDQWIAELKKKYPVNVDEKVLAGLTNPLNPLKGE